MNLRFCRDLMQDAGFESYQSAHPHFLALFQIFTGHKTAATGKAKNCYRLVRPVSGKHGTVSELYLQ